MKTARIGPVHRIVRDARSDSPKAVFRYPTGRAFRLSLIVVRYAQA